MAVTRIDVEAVRLPSGTLELRFCTTGIISDLHIPLRADPAHADGLWRHTCFEAFIRGPQDAGYYELNFSPSTEWAAHRFSGYRSGMSNKQIGPPRTKVKSDRTLLELWTALELGGLTDLPRDAPWHLGVSAVVEEKNGQISYWALEHPSGRADFHHPDCFAHTLAATVSR